MNYREIIDRIKKLNIPAQAKADLLMLWHRCKRLVESILQFLERHREFTEAMLLGSTQSNPVGAGLDAMKPIRSHSRLCSGCVVRKFTSGHMRDNRLEVIV